MSNPYTSEKNKKRPRLLRHYNEKPSVIPGCPGHTQPKPAGVCAGNRVVVRCMAPKLTEVALTFQFQPNKWYHLVITHSTGSALSSSVVRMFVDGSLEASSRFKYVKVSLCFVLTVHFVCRQNL